MSNGQAGHLQVEIKRGLNLLPNGLYTVGLALVSANAGTSIRRTTPHKGPNPQWQQQYTFHLANAAYPELQVSLWNGELLVGSDLIPVGDLPLNRPVSQDLNLQGCSIFLVLFMSKTRGTPSVPNGAYPPTAFYHSPTAVSYHAATVGHPFAAPDYATSDSTHSPPAVDYHTIAAVCKSSASSAVMHTARLSHAGSQDSFGSSAQDLAHGERPNAIRKLLEVKVTSAKGFESLPECHIAVQLVMDTWRAQTTAKTNQNVAIWNESFGVEVEQHGSLLWLTVLDAVSQQALATGEVDCAALPWDSGPLQMRSVPVHGDEGHTGTVNLLFRTAVPQLLSAWARRCSPRSSRSEPLALGMPVAQHTSDPDPMALIRRDAVPLQYVSATTIPSDAPSLILPAAVPSSPPTSVTRTRLTQSPAPATAARVEAVHMNVDPYTAPTAIGYSQNTIGYSPTAAADRPASGASVVHSSRHMSDSVRSVESFEGRLAVLEPAHWDRSLTSRTPVGSPPTASSASVAGSMRYVSSSTGPVDPVDPRPLSVGPKSMTSLPPAALVSRAAEAYAPSMVPASETRLRLKRMSAANKAAPATAAVEVAVRKNEAPSAKRSVVRMRLSQGDWSVTTPPMQDIVKEHVVRAPVPSCSPLGTLELEVHDSAPQQKCIGRGTLELSQVREHGHARFDVPLHSSATGRAVGDVQLDARFLPAPAAGSPVPGPAHGDRPPPAQAAVAFQAPSGSSATCGVEHACSRAASVTPDKLLVHHDAMRLATQSESRRTAATPTDGVRVLIQSLSCTIAGPHRAFWGSHGALSMRMTVHNGTDPVTHTTSDVPKAVQVEWQEVLQFAVERCPAVAELQLQERKGHRKQTVARYSVDLREALQRHKVKVMLEPVDDTAATITALICYSTIPLTASLTASHSPSHSPSHVPQCTPSPSPKPTPTVKTPSAASPSAAVPARQDAARAAAASTAVAPAAASEHPLATDPAAALALGFALALAFTPSTATSAADAPAWAPTPPPVAYDAPTHATGCTPVRVSQASSRPQEVLPPPKATAEMVTPASTTPPRTTWPLAAVSPTAAVSPLADASWLAVSSATAATAAASPDTGLSPSPTTPPLQPTSCSPATSPFPLCTSAAISPSKSTWPTATD